MPVFSQTDGNAVPPNGKCIYCGVLLIRFITNVSFPIKYSPAKCPSCKGLYTGARQYLAYTMCPSKLLEKSEIRTLVQ